MAKNSTKIKRIFGGLFLSAVLFAALLGGPIVILLVLASRFTQ
jgi:hypothetical protein